jgi:pimeloyl-ACP methyl ester carboxylesterase
VFCRPESDPEEGARSVLLIHGLGESSRCFEPILATRFEGWNLLAPDLPGYGKTPSEQVRTLSQFAQLLGHWIAASDPSPLVLVGHSMGGVIGQFLCGIHPDRISAFLNVEGNLSLQDCTYSSQASACTPAEFRESGFSRLIAEVAAAGRSDPASASYAASMQQCHPTQFHTNSLELVEVSASERLAGEMAASLVQSLYIAGLRGRGGSRSIQLLETHQVRWLGFEHSGHWPFVDEPDRFIGLLRSLLSALESNPGGRKVFPARVAQNGA